MQSELQRTAMLLGLDGIEKLQHARVAVFGLGGVGGHVVEALVRSGIGAIDLIDNDIVQASNMNRQIVADYNTIGKDKTIAMKEKIKTLSSQCNVTAYSLFYLPEIAEKIPFSKFDYIVDAIDTVTAKLDLIERANQYNVPIISSMGTGNKLHPEQLQFADIYDTSICPLAKVMRKECRARNIQRLQVVYSKEVAKVPLEIEENSLSKGRRSTPGSTAFVPAVAGLLIASKVIQELSGVK